VSFLGGDSFDFII